MSATLIATLAGLIVAVCWGTSDWLTARSSKQYDALEINLAAQTVSATLAVVILIFNGLHVHDATEVIKIALSSVLIVTGYLVFIKALSSGVLGIVVPLGNIYPFVTIVLSMVFLSVHIKSIQLAAMVTIILGASLLAYEKNIKKVPLRELHKDTILALIAALIWGLGFFVLNQVVDKVSWQSITVISETTAFVWAFLLLVVSKRQQAINAIKRTSRAKLPITVGVLGITGMVALYYGSTRAGSVLIPAVLSAGAPLVTSLLGAVFEGERLGILKRVGAVVIVGGVIILNTA